MPQDSGTYVPPVCVAVEYEFRDDHAERVREECVFFPSQRTAAAELVSESGEWVYAQFRGRTLP